MLAMAIRQKPIALMLGGTDKGSAAHGRLETSARILAADSLQMQQTWTHLVQLKVVPHGPHHVDRHAVLPDAAAQRGQRPRRMG
jgi:hypothetical protein